MTREIDRKWQRIRKRRTFLAAINRYEAAREILNKLSIQDRAYIAGLLDGEGSIGCYFARGGKTIGKKVDIANTSQMLMQWLILKVPFLRIVPHHSSRYNPNAMDAFHAVVSDSQRIVAFLDAIIPFLIIKRTRAELMISICRSRWHTRGPLTPEVTESVNQIKILNRRGINATTAA